MSRSERDLIARQVKLRQPRLFRSAGSAGYEAAVGYLRWEVAEASLRIRGAPATVTELVWEALGRIGTRQRGDSDLVAAVGTGWRGLNTASVTAKVSTSGDSDWAEVAVRSVAAEGLIKQHGGEKAREALLSELVRSAEVIIESRRVTLERAEGAASRGRRVPVLVAAVVLALWGAAILLQVLAHGSWHALAAGLLVAGLAVSIVGTVLTRRHDGA